MEDDSEKRKLMFRISVEIKWCVKKIGDKNTQYMKYCVFGNTLDEVLENEMEKLGIQYQAPFMYEKYTKTSIFARYEPFYLNSEEVGQISLSIETP